MALSSPHAWVPVAAALLVGGWGANQFAPLSVVYRTEAGWPALTVIAMFTIYLLGLVPALLLGTSVARRFGRRRVVCVALAVTAGASGVLAVAVFSPDAVYLSRLVTGVATGLIVSAAGGWLQALSVDDTPEAGMRRAVVATGAGFALGPLVAGAIAEWSLDPMVLPAVVHGAVALVVLIAVRRVPDVAGTQVLGGPAAGNLAEQGRERWTAVTHPRFIGIVLPASPAVFAAVTVSYVVLPPLVVDRVGDYAPLFSGLVAAVTLTVGLLVQPVAVRIDRPGSARAILVAMAVVVVGLLVGAVAVELVSPAAVLVAAVVLGAGYGLTIEAGLAEIARLASPRTLPTASAAFQGVAHSGFLAPLLLAVTAASVPYPVLLVGLALVGLALLAVAATISRRHGQREVRRGVRSGVAAERSQPWVE